MSDQTSSGSPQPITSVSGADAARIAWAAFDLVAISLITAVGGALGGRLRVHDGPIVH